MISVHKISHYVCLPVVAWKYPIKFRGHRWRNWLHGNSCDNNNLSEISTSEKRPCHSLSSVRRHGSVLQIHQGWRKGWVFSHQPAFSCPLSSYFHFGIPLWRFAVTQCSIQNTKWGSSWHFQSIRVCRMVVACKVSLKQCLNFWTCHLVFLPCYCMCTLAVFLLQVEEGTREVGLCVNFPN